MAEYIDSSVQRKTEYLRDWLDVNLSETARAFRTQCGYFRYNAIEPFEAPLNGIAAKGGILRFVVGANDGDLCAADLHDLWRILEHTTAASLSVVRLMGAKFHPKCYHIERADGSETAIVGSANLTENGSLLNVEASIVLDTMRGDPHDILQRVAGSIDDWAAKREGDGLFHIKSGRDIDALARDKIIDVVNPRLILQRITSKTERDKSAKLGRRVSLWRRSTRRRPTPRATDSTKVLITENPHSTTIEIQTVVKRWSKRLQASDAQQVRAGTNPTGKLRLAKAGHDIDFKTWFRKVFFADANWVRQVKGGKTYEVAEVPFHVRLLDKEIGEQVLTIDHARHRISGQNNVPTVLTWGHTLMKELGGHSYVSQYVVLERYESGLYRLEIKDEPPEPTAIV